MLTGHDVQRGQRGDEWRPNEIDELGQIIGGHLRTVQATAEVEDGTIGGGDHLGGLSQAPLIGFAGQTVAGQVPDRGPYELSGPLLGVLGDVDEDRSRAPGRGHMEGLSHTRNDVLGTGDEEGVLDEGHRGTDDVSLLEGIRPDSTTSDLAGDGQHRHRVHVCVGDGGDEVGSPGAGCRHADSGPA